MASTSAVSATSAVNATSTCSEGASADKGIESPGHIRDLREAGYHATCRIGETYSNRPAVATAPEQVVYVQDSNHQFSGEGSERATAVSLDNCDTGACEIPSKFTST